MILNNITTSKRYRVVVVFTITTVLLLFSNGVRSLQQYNDGESCPGYNLVKSSPTNSGQSASLILQNAGPYGSDITQLTVDATYLTQDILRVKIYDSNNQRWEVPNINQFSTPTTTPSTLKYAIQFSESPSFGFQVIRTSDSMVLFNTTPPTDCSLNGLIFEDYYLEISNTFDELNPNIYGLGERTTSLRLENNRTYTIFSRDQGTASKPFINTYGVHPFYLQMHSDGTASGVFLLNSNAMDVVLTEQSMTYKTVGGVLDFFFFVGPSPREVIQQYHQVIGYPKMPAYWSLGWHQCRWGYHTLEDTEAVVANYYKNGIPLETMWNDIDYMNSYEVFTTDPTRFPVSNFSQFIDYLHENGQHYMMIVDPGVKIVSDNSYPSHNDLLESNAYITKADGVTPVLGSVWPGPVNFPDFFHPNGTNYWIEQFSAFREMGITFDGVWIDMNEISNFCNGDCSSSSNTRQSETSSIFNPNNPPYLPGGVLLNIDTINLTDTQYGGLSVYNTHSLYGYSEGVATTIAAEKLIGGRSLVIGRSTFAGSGAHQGHWLGDNDSTYTDMYYSIPGILVMNMFGIPMIGADICGFNGATTAELCARWTQLGCFYPFSRNHNSINMPSQEPYVFGQQVTDIAIASINNKYTLLPYYYTLFYQANTNGSTVVRPLFFEYPLDSNTYSIDQQFLVGGHLLVSPVLTEGSVSVNAYFPADQWYDYFTGESVASTITGQYLTLDAPLETINVHVRGGVVLPLQPTSQYSSSDNPAPITLKVARTLPYQLLIALDETSTAKGYLFIDDGMSLDSIESNDFDFIEFKVEKNELKSKPIITAFNNQTIASTTLATLQVYGVQSPVTQVQLNQQTSLPFTYNATVQTLFVNVTSIDLLTPFKINWN
ncbi:hypothetical protein PPL_02349 [Heterostelium album PN500]|uniref:Maltase n=1 Tax=Heterostelium pallidum (strain ATCC 26659 / Pp 5 / PN500) TaxID=670386 RepID=D3B222_HETP5|nr:hypothetical protein PPL_02349 [Heterostelium album PN500]EFA85346.1 hypothetical protein PPL_02349 [Heterostelium album PN500]|eukprot:XP_020437455.1 hypothetical protein PPL_02349 [Heterostelium album PN500]